MTEKVRKRDTKPPIDKLETCPICDTPFFVGWCTGCGYRSKEEEVEKVEVVLTKFKDCKHSVQFKSGDNDAPLYAIYVKRPHFEHVREIKVTIERHLDDEGRS